MPLSERGWRWAVSPPSVRPRRWRAAARFRRSPGSAAPAGTGALERQAPGAAGSSARGHQRANQALLTRVRSARPTGEPGTAARSAPRPSASATARRSSAGCRPPSRREAGMHTHQTYFLLPNELRQKDLSVVKAAFGRSTNPSRGAFAAAAPDGRDEPAPANLTPIHKKVPGLLPLSPPCCCGNTAKRCENALNEQTPHKYSGFKSHLESCPGFQTRSRLLSSHHPAPRCIAPAPRSPSATRWRGRTAASTTAPPSQGDLGGTLRDTRASRETPFGNTGLLFSTTAQQNPNICRELHHLSSAIE